MADEKKPVASGGFKIPEWGPKKLRKIFKIIEAKINSITPVQGIGTTVDIGPAGTQIHAGIQMAPQGASGSAEAVIGSSGGTNVDLYGAFNAAAAIFHLKQSSPPTAL